MHVDLHMKHPKIVCPLHARLASLWKQYVWATIRDGYSYPTLWSMYCRYLYNNFLSGTIPSEMGCMPNLTIISLHTNKVGGPLPSELANLKKLKHMDFNNNLLTRTIPSELGSMVNLDRLILHDNLFTGRIPVSIMGMSCLDSLWLNSNRLSGPIPTQLEQLSMLTLVHLQRNLLTGSIPKVLAGLTQLANMCVCENMGLCGDIPQGVALDTSVICSQGPTSGTRLGFECWQHLEVFQRSGSQSKRWRTDSAPALHMVFLGSCQNLCTRLNRKSY